MRGRKPKPTAIKLLDGTRADRINRNEPRSTGAPVRPTWLDREAAKEWDRIVPILQEMQVLSKIDGPMLAIYCQAHSDYQQARKKLKSLGSVTPTGAGGVKPSPYLQIARDARAEMARILVEFGGTPVSRSRIKVAGASEADELDEFLKKGTG